ncbi:hypothetical protein SAMN04487944_10862 [Gracilibacillus ureilyticus]|uniref:Uncharacterized protein n=1 Tax=Gracilibacillus ureilyticus TaxID=531814 RepID=A0A1H9R7I8_9BACI|nr:hypothetical protein [Gracilibacillus ureilyticus]SER68841.1 hypothetical protein SAMN04487944_10862 [Gracilibacillus ureilyticus]
MWKKVVFSLLGLVITGAGLFVYFLFIKNYDIEDEQVDDIVEDEYEITLPDSPPVENQDEGDSENIATENDNNSINNSDPDEDTPDKSVEIYNENHSDDDGTSSDFREKNAVRVEIKGQEEQTAEEIVSKYQQTFTSLQNQANARLSELAAYAYGEYKEKKKSGENVSYTYLFQKYKSAADRLENKTDSAFNQVYHQLVNELESNGFSKSEAQPVYDQYVSKKSSKKSQLMKEMLSHVN